MEEEERRRCVLCRGGVLVGDKRLAARAEWRSEPAVGEVTMAVRSTVPCFKMAVVGSRRAEGLIACSRGAGREVIMVEAGAPSGNRPPAEWGTFRHGVAYVKFGQRFQNGYRHPIRARESANDVNQVGEQHAVAVGEIVPKDPFRNTRVV
ncbi:hypothetical protein BC826DRAFT_982630 [Russula brevipes]|nr:hypothetical protein BC826DRAFT_982630 [Russula brevipes]